MTMETRAVRLVAVSVLSPVSPAATRQHRQFQCRVHGTCLRHVHADTVRQAYYSTRTKVSAGSLNSQPHHAGCTSIALLFYHKWKFNLHIALEIDLVVHELGFEKSNYSNTLYTTL